MKLRDDVEQPSPARLVPYRSQAGAQVLGWVRSPLELKQWCGRDDFPLLDGSVLAAWHRDPEVHPYLFERAGTLLGYGEVWQDRAEQEVELARILLAPEARGRGLGQQLTALLLERGLACALGPVWMRVAPGNLKALRCYTGLGFVRASTAQQQTFNAAQPMAYVWLRWPG